MVSIKIGVYRFTAELGGAPMKDEEFNCNARPGRNPFAAIYSDIGALAIPQDKEAQKYQLWEWIDNGHP
jgi:hypothetical protein